MLYGMLGLAVWRVGQLHSESLSAASRTVIANMNPQPAGLGLARARLKNRNRRIIPMQFRRGEHVTLQRIHQRL